MQFHITDYDRGKADGYYGDEPDESGSEEYYKGYRAGQQDFAEAALADDGHPTGLPYGDPYIEWNEANDYL